MVHRQGGHGGGAHGGDSGTRMVCSCAYEIGCGVDVCLDSDAWTHLCMLGLPCGPNSCAILLSIQGRLWLLRPCGLCKHVILCGLCTNAMLPYFQGKCGILLCDLNRC